MAVESIYRQVLVGSFSSSHREGRWFDPSRDHKKIAARWVIPTPSFAPDRVFPDGSTCALITASPAPASRPGTFREGTPRTAGNLPRSQSPRRRRTRGPSRSRPGLSSAAQRCNPTRRRCGYVGVRQGFPVSRSDTPCDLLRGACTSSPPRPQLRGVVEDQGEGDAFAGSYGRDSVSDRSCRPPALGLDGTVSGGEHVAMALRQQERGSP